MSSSSMTVREFEAIFRRLYLPLGMYALRIVGDTDDAEDIVEDAFMRVWRKIRDGEEVDNLRPFLYQTVRNGCVSFLRAKKETVGVEFIPEVDEEAVDTSMRDALIWKAIDNLPARCREVFLLSKRDGLTNEEIASELDVSVKTVKNQMTKAYAKLRETLSSGHKPFFLPFL